MKNKKRLICSICAVFMLAFSLILIPFSKIDNASAFSVINNTFNSDVYYFMDGKTSDEDSGLRYSYYGDFSITSGQSINANINYNYVTVNTNFRAMMNSLSSTLTLGLRQIDYVVANNYSSFSVPANTIVSNWYRTYDYSTATYSRDVLVNGYPVVLTGFTSDAWINFCYLIVPNTIKDFYSTPEEIWTGDVVSVSFGSSMSNPILNQSSLTNIKYNYINFTDNYNNKFYFIIKDASVFAEDSSSYYVIGSYWNYQTYYLRSSMTDNEYFNSGYNEGFNIGYTEGENTGYNTGYAEGFNNGENTGYGNGYNDGLETADNFTFLGLIGATIDAPIKAFRGLFNFELLGVNMVSLITGLFTLCVIVAIVKICLGGK